MKRTLRTTKKLNVEERCKVVAKLLPLKGMMWGVRVARGEAATRLGVSIWQIEKVAREGW